MKKHNACISIVSSRTKCLRKCLESLHKFYNHKYDYPVYVFYFDDIYDSEDYRNDVNENISSNIRFVNIPYNSPSHVQEEEMFYNRTNLEYVQKGFSKKRKGYLHMCHFLINFYGHPNTEFEKYDYVMTHDDEAGYDKEMTEDPFEVISANSIDMASYITGQRLRNGAPHQGHRDTRIGLWEFTRNFLIDNDIQPKCKLLQDLMVDEQAEDNFHYLPWSDSYVINLNVMKTDLYKLWTKAVNDNGGVYKYRWGDNEIMSLFGMMYGEDPIHDLGYVKNGFHNQGKFRSMQNCAPGVKDGDR